MPKKNLLLIFAFFCILPSFLAGPAFSQIPLPQAGAVDAPPPMKVAWEAYALSPERGGLIAVLWVTPDAGWYTYSNAPGETGMPTRLSATTEDGATLQVLYPPGRPKPDALEPDKTVNVYEGRTPLFVPVMSPPETGLRIEGELALLLCSKGSCLPVRQAVSFEAGTGIYPLAKDQPWWPLFVEAMQAMRSAQAMGSPPAGPGTMPPASPPPGMTRPTPQVSGDGWDISPHYFSPGLEVGRLWQALLFAFLAGAILNVMPCVLPVVGLKIFGVVSSIPKEDIRRQQAAFREKNLFFALGILLYFLGLSLVLGLAGLAWGQLFQMPGVVLVVTAVVFGLGLSLLGVFDLPVVDLKSPRGAERNPRLQALFTGILATLLATPCSGPFLGGVLAWTLLQAPAVVSLVFLFIGLGMASPYLIFAIRPEAARFFPKPGPWVLQVERLVAFFLFGTCIYLFSILPAEHHVAGLVLLLAAAFAAWMWGKWTTLSDPRPRRLLIRALAALLFLSTTAWAVQPRIQVIHWRPFEAAEFRANLGAQRMLVDFTADWCPNCKLLEKTVLTEKNNAALAEKYGLTLVQVDLTRDNPDGLALLRALGSQSIPVVAIFPEGEESRRPLVLRDLFTREQLGQALEGLFRQKK